MSAAPAPSHPVSHLIDAHRAPWAVLHALATLADEPEHRVVLFGNSNDARRARHAGLVRFRQIRARGNDPANASRQLRSLCAHSAVSAPLLAWNDSAHFAAARAGVNAARFEHYDALDGAFPDDSLDRETLRRAWGIDARTRVLMPANDHPSDIDAMRLAYLAGILSVAGKPTVAIAPSSSRHLDRAARFNWRHGRARWVIIDDRSPILLRDAADASWWQRTQGDVGTHTLRMLLRAGLPGAADRSPGTARIDHAKLTLCDPAQELAPMGILGSDLVRSAQAPDCASFRRAVEASIGQMASLAAG